jgi:hypothetical protein
MTTRPLLAVGLVCALTLSCEELRIQTGATDYPEGATVAIVLMTLDNPTFGSVATMIPAVSVAVTLSSTTCGTLTPPATVVTGPTGRAQVMYTAPIGLGASCSVTITAVATGTVTPFSETETRTITIHPPTILGTGGTAVDSITVHQPQTGEQWWVYSVTAKTGTGAINVGDGFCILCPGATQYPYGMTPNSPITVSPAPGITYTLGSPLANCTNCPDLTTYEFDTLPPVR